MPSYSASSWATVSPPCSLMARSPIVPSLPVPDRMMPAAFSAVGLGERGEEAVDGHALAAMLARRTELQAVA